MANFYIDNIDGRTVAAKSGCTVVVHGKYFRLGDGEGRTLIDVCTKLYGEQFGKIVKKGSFYYGSKPNKNWQVNTCGGIAFATVEKATLAISTAFANANIDSNNRLTFG